MIIFGPNVLSALITLASRDARHFDDLEVPVVNTWAQTP